MYSISNKFNNNKLIEHYNASEKLAAKGLLPLSKDEKIAKLTNQSQTPGVLIESNENVTYTAPAPAPAPAQTSNYAAGGISFNILLFVFTVAVLCMYFKHKQICD